MPVFSKPLFIADNSFCDNLPAKIAGVISVSWLHPDKYMSLQSSVFFFQGLLFPYFTEVKIHGRGNQIAWVWILVLLCWGKSLSSSLSLRFLLYKMEAMKTTCLIVLSWGSIQQIQASPANSARQTGNSQSTSAVLIISFISSSWSYRHRKIYTFFHDYKKQNGDSNFKYSPFTGNLSKPASYLPASLC